MTAPWITVIMPARNAASVIGACLRSINADRLALGDSEVIVVDNGSTDGTPEIAAGAGASVVPLPGLRVSALRNRAASLARAPLLAFIDADHELGSGWCEAVRDNFADPSVSAAGAPCHAPPDGTWVQRAYDCLRRHDGRRRDATWLGSGNLVIRADVFRQLGGFDEQLETCEDVDLCRRLLIAGKRLVEDPRLVNIHHGDPRTLRAVFLGELWRGRDNLRVTFRPPLEIRSVLSAIQPATTLAIVAALFLLALVSGSLWWLVAAATFVLVASVPRWLQMMSRANTMTLGTWFKCASVAVVFDLGRAAALVARASHSWRGGSSPVIRGASKT
jgi:glycosyltransferase involved in cell wall biosynthesis